VITLLFLTLSSLAGEPTVWVSKFMGSESFKGDYLWGYTKKNGYYDEDNALSVRINEGGCASRLQELQKYALEKMLEIKYITPEQVKELGSFAEYQYAPSQVTFFTMRDTASGRPDHLADSKTLASLWTVSRFSLSNPGEVKSLKIRTKNLPWQNDPDFKTLSDEFEAKKEPLVWEIGRAAQSSPDGLDELLPFALISMMQEMIALHPLLDQSGAPITRFEQFDAMLDHASVMFHSLSPMHTRAYNIRHPGRRYPPGDTNNKNTLFKVPFREMLAKYPLENKLKVIRDLIDRSGGTWKSENAVGFLNEVLRKRYVEADVYMPDRNVLSPLVVSVLSQGQILTPNGFMEAWRIPKGREADVMSFTAQHKQLFFLPTQSRQQDWVPPEIFQDETQANRAIYLTNLSSTALNKLSGMPQAMMAHHYLLAGLKVALEAIVEPMGRERYGDLLQLAKNIARNGTKISIGVSDPRLFPILELFSPVKTYEKDYVDFPSYTMGIIHRVEQTGTHAKLFVYDLEKLIPFFEVYLGTSQKVLTGENKIWNSYFKMMNPYLF